MISPEWMTLIEDDGVFAVSMSKLPLFRLNTFQEAGVWGDVNDCSKFGSFYQGYKSWE